MKNLWTYIDSRNWKADTKYKTVLVLFGILFALAGLTLWLIIRRWALSTPDWMICFIGYPIVLSWFFVFFYSCRHELHNGAVVH